MKKNFRLILIVALLITLPVLVMAKDSAQISNRINAPVNAPVGSRMPLGGSIIILLAMAASYGASVLYEKRSADSDIE
ncbi:MAG: hypothetical protein ACOYMF_10120 [Bacteroidales bacterium]